MQTGLVEKFGRKPLLVLSDFFVFLSMLAVGIYFKMEESCLECHMKAFEPRDLISQKWTFSEETVSSFSWVPLVGLMVFVFFFMLGLPLAWFLNVELMPTEARVGYNSFSITYSIKGIF